MSFAKLKKMSGKESLAKLNASLEKVAGGGFQNTDERFWYPNIDKAGNGFSIVRFLPAPEGEDVPFVKIFKHRFKGPGGKWYIENSLTTLGQDDPVGKFNSHLWGLSEDDDSPSRKQARAQKRNLEFIANVYIVKDELNPENEGKVKLFRFGKMIFDMVNGAANPDEKMGDEPVDAFDLWDGGANFAIRIFKDKSGYRKYTNSKFMQKKPLADDEEMEAIWKQAYPLQPFLAPSEFKSYEELEKKLNAVLQINGSTGSAGPEAEAPKQRESTAQRFKTAEEKMQAETKSKATQEDEGDTDEPPFTPDAETKPAAEEDSGLSYFQKLTKKGK